MYISCKNTTVKWSVKVTQIKTTQVKMTEFNTTCETDLLLQHEYININQNDVTLDLLCRSLWKSDDGAPATNVFFDKDFLDKNASH